MSAQTYPITGITISLPPNPDASFTKMGTGTLMLSITASAKQVNGRIDPRLESSNILVTIKKGGAKICGLYTSSSAPSANFNSPIKVWSGNNAVSLLGQDCTLAPGDYEFCVQFFGQGPTGLAPLSEEKCKAFMIKAHEQQAYQPPQLITPANGKVLKETDLKKPMSFRWISVVPRPQEPVTYRLRIWQLMQGQSSAQAIIQQPLLVNDVGNITQTTINNIQYAPCKPPYLCDFIWNVQALNRDGKPIGGNNGTSEAFKISVDPVNYQPSMLKLLMPKNGFILSANENSKFTWTNFFPGDNDGDGYYKIKIVEIKGDQSPEDALANNKPFFEKDSLIRPSFEYPTSAPKFESGKKYGWRVQAFRRDEKPIGESNGTSELFSFKIKDEIASAELCECGRWNPLSIRLENGLKRYDCGSKILWNCKRPFEFTSSYQCNPNDESCQAKTAWEIKKGSVVIKAGTGTNNLSDGFDLTENGTYTLILSATCNGIKCKPCTYTIIVEDCK